jgi:uncharacterized protein YraI
MNKRIVGLALVAVALCLFSLVSPNTISAQTFGSGWTATYYNNTSLTGSPVFTEVLPGGINFTWGTGSPNAAVPVDNWSARFDSTQLFNAGTYEFVVASDDGVRVYIDNVLVWDRFVGRVLTTDRFQQTLTAGSHILRVEYFEGIDLAALQFQWFQVSTGGTVIPGFPTVTPFGTPAPTLGPSPTPLPPTQTPLPAIPPGALSGTVVRASVLLVRGAPFLGAPVVGRVRRGQTYQVVGRDDRALWFLIQLSDRQGWVWGYYLNVNGNEFNAPVQSPYITQGDPAAATGVVGVSEAVLRLRAAPLVGTEQIGRIPWGDILPIIGRTAGGDWYQVVFRGTTGWVAAEYIRIIEGDLGAVPVIQ